MTEKMFKDIDFTKFWDDDPYYKEEYEEEIPGAEEISRIENQLGYKLPRAYIALMQERNGGAPIKNCYPTSEATSWAEDHIAITGIFGIGQQKPSTLCGDCGSIFWIEEWGYPADGIYIGDCPSAGHDMILLDYSACGPQGEPVVVHVDQENNYKKTFLADDFETFVRGLRESSAFSDD